MEINLLYHIDNLFFVNSLFYECCNFWERSARPYLELYLRPILVVQSSRVQIPWVHFFSENWLQLALNELSCKKKFKRKIQKLAPTIDNWTFWTFEFIFFWVQMLLNSNGKWVQKFKEFTFFFTSEVFVNKLQLQILLYSLYI